MVNVFIRTGEGRIITEHDPACLASALKDPKAVFWVDMDKPTEEELGLLDDVFGFHPLAIEDTHLLQPAAQDRKLQPRRRPA